MNEAMGLTSGKYISKRRRSKSNSRRIRQRPLDIQSIIPCKDNIPSLPEDVALKITSKLTLKEAAQMCVLSSAWRQACVFHPNLYFDTQTVLGNHGNSEVICSDHRKRALSINKFIDRVDAILKNHCMTQVNKFAVEFGLSAEHASHIDRWVSFAIASKARVVILNLSPNRSPFDRNDYDFPFQLFNDQSGSYLQDLQLHSVTLAPPPDFCGFANLKMLALDSVTASQDLEHLLSKCCVLEWLRIRWCFQLPSLRVREPLCRLQYLFIQDCAFHEIEFHSPNLMTFEYRGFPALMNLNDCLKLKTATIRISGNNTLEYVLTRIPSKLPHVDTLCVELRLMSEISGFTRSPLKFIQLRHLTMEVTSWDDPNSVFQLAYLLEAAPLLEDLHFNMFGFYPIYGTDMDAKIVDLPHYHLKTVCMSGFCGNDGQVELAKYILKNALTLQHLIVKPTVKYEGSILTEWDDPIGRRKANEKLAPLDRNNVLTIM